MAHPFKIVGVIALAAAAACTTDPIAPTLKSPTLGTADVTAASTHNVVVTESDIARQSDGTLPTRNWVFYRVFPTTATGAFVSGPSDPPLGVGSFEIATPSATDHGFLFNYEHIGTRLADITSISYATYSEPTSTAPFFQLPSINIEVDFNGPDVAGGYTSLVFEPVYNPAQGPIVKDVWQTWNGISNSTGIWWSTRDIGGVSAVTYVPWSVIVAANPNATILGGFGVNQGSGSGGLIAATDALTIGANGTTWTYNFEPFRSKKDCKKAAKADDDGKDKDKNKDKCKDKDKSSDED